MGQAPRTLAWKGLERYSFVAEIRDRDARPAMALPPSSSDPVSAPASAQRLGCETSPLVQGC